MKEREEGKKGRKEREEEGGLRVKGDVRERIRKREEGKKGRKKEERGRVENKEFC